MIRPTSRSLLPPLSCLLLLAACGSGEQDSPAETSPAPVQDMRADAQDMSAGGQEDMAPPVDMSEPPLDMTPTQQPDMAATQDLGVDMAQECAPEAVAAEQVAVNTQVASGDFSVEALSTGWRATLDAGVGGAAMAAQSSYLYLDLDSGELVALSDVDAHKDGSWELAIKRAEIRLNSADSGPQPLLLARVEGASFEDATPPGPEGEWSQDDFVGPSCELITYGRGSLATAFGQWYDYDPSTHTVSAPEQVTYYIYHPGTHALIKLAIESYDAGLYTLRWE